MKRRNVVKSFVLGLAIFAFIAINAIAQTVPPSVEQQIKQIYTQKYPNDYSMQKILVEDQLKSYRFIQKWTSEPGVPQDIFIEIKKIYAQKYPNDYSMQKILIQDQCESYRFLQSYVSVPGIPNDVLMNLKQKYI